MCLAVPAEIVSIENGVATCKVEGSPTTINASLMLLDGKVQPGDYLIIHAGFALRKLDPEEARETIRLLMEVAELADAAGVQQDDPVSLD